MPDTRKSLTVRLPAPVYERSLALARRRGVSLNRLMAEGLGRLLREEQQNQLYHDFTLLGEDAEGSDVEFAFEAQREVVTRDEG